MTEIERAQIVRLPGGRATITGTVDQVGVMVARLESTGRLVSTTMPVPTGVPGQVLVNVGLVPRVRQAARPAPLRRHLSGRTVGLIAVGVGGAVVGLGWLIYAAVTALVENAAAIAGALLVVAVVLVVVGKGRGRTFSGTFQGGID